MVRNKTIINGFFSFVFFFSFIGLIAQSTVTVAWLGTGDATLYVNKDSYSFLQNQKQVLALPASKESKIAIDFAGKRYDYPNPVRFKPGAQNLIVSISHDSLKVLVSNSIQNDIATEMVLIKGGTYNKGCANTWGCACIGWEMSHDTVTLSDFSIAKYDITQSQWEAVMGYNPSYFSGCLACPVENVSWNDAQEFIARLNILTGLRYRLPTDAEWEYAARGGEKSKGDYFGIIHPGSIQWRNFNGDTWRYVTGAEPPSHVKCEPLFKSITWDDAQYFISKLNQLGWGQYVAPSREEWEKIRNDPANQYAGSNNLDEVAWYYSNSDYKTHPVGLKKPNELGLYDMNGNVWQWCNNWFEIDSLDYDNIKVYYQRVTNPQGPESGVKRSVRGSAWDLNKMYFRVTMRYGYKPTERCSNIGFRVALDN